MSNHLTKQMTSTITDALEAYGIKVEHDAHDQFTIIDPDYETTIVIDAYRERREREIDRPRRYKGVRVR